MPKLNLKKSNLKSKQYKTKKTIKKNNKKVGGSYVEDYASLKKKFENFSRVELINYIGENTKTFNDVIEENENLKEKEKEIYNIINYYEEELQKLKNLIDKQEKVIEKQQEVIENNKEQVSEQEIFKAERDILNEDVSNITKKIKQFSSNK